MTRTAIFPLRRGKAGYPYPCGYAGGIVPAHRLLIWDKEIRRQEGDDSKKITKRNGRRKDTVGFGIQQKNGVDNVEDHAWNAPKTD